jgi:3-phenylpropionate/trans-cinnamate dioxygenase ferredoxin component
MFPACPLSSIPRGESYRWKVDPPVAIFHTEDGQVFAIDDTCTHQDASLSDGWLEGCEIECPLHASRFDLRTGQVDAPPAKKPVRTHRVMISDGVIHVALSNPEPNRPPGPATAARDSPA